MFNKHQHRQHLAQIRELRQRRYERAVYLAAATGSTLYEAIVDFFESESYITHREPLICPHSNEVYSFDEEDNFFQTGEYDRPVHNEHEDAFVWSEYSDEYIFADTAILAYHRVGWRTQSYYISESTYEYSDDFVTTTDGEVWLHHDARQLANGDYISLDQLENGDYSDCADCHDLMHVDDMRYDDNTEEYCCDYCYNQRDHDDDRLIYNYDYKPEPHFHNLNGESLDELFGIEDEVDSTEWLHRDSGASLVYDHLDTLAYCKNDGSLSHGFEIVTHPATYEYLYSVKPKVAELFSDLTAKGWRSHNTDTCGLHIHISRKAFVNREAQERFIFLFEKFYDHILKFTRRTQEKLNHWAARYGIYSDTDDSRSFSSKLRGAYTRKYQIVNQLHQHTLEVRAFRGTLNVDTWYASLQFMRLMAKIANKSLVADGVTWASICKLAKVDGYTELVEYLKKRELFEDKTVKPVKRPKRKKIAIKKGDAFVVIGNSNRCDHNFAIGTPVKLVSDTGLDSDTLYYVNDIGYAQWVIFDDLALTDGTPLRDCVITN